ncbi:hypothetical protein EV426DRAFT_616215 [Tirmania nivea]|nr:hypothetical protein EV426DRAFT_616215 [Tirmania nivea]
MPGTSLLLARYNDSMHLGQGFNSFLQVPCVDNAMTFDQSKVVVERANACPADVSQMVSYSSRFVEKISDVVRVMNISAGSLIKNGSIDVSGNPIWIDEAKFLSSDMNVVVSVKVINQATRLVDQAVFEPIEHSPVDNDKFFEIYGDCYISGFVDGGELHGIVSIKVLDATNKKDVEKAIKKRMNAMGGPPELTPSECSDGSQLSSTLSKTETTLSVSWSGGGQIKLINEEWSLDTLFRAAAEFPARVASCPQRTWAILTKYDNSRDFVRWADKNKITIPQFQGIQAYTSELLDMYMGYKNNIARLQAVLRNPKDYVRSSAPDAISINIAALVEKRKKMKAQMGLIVKEIDTLCVHPEKIEEIEGKSQIQSPEAWATRLPVPQTAVTDEGGFTSTAEAALESTLRKTSEPVTSIDIHPLCTSAVEAMMSPYERAFVTSLDSKSEFQSYRFDIPCGSPFGAPFNDAAELQKAVVLVTWPKWIEINLVQYRDWEYPMVGWYKIQYDQLTLQHGGTLKAIKTLSMGLSHDELITKVRLAAGKCCRGLFGVIFMEIETSQGRVGSVGDAHGNYIIEGVAPAGFLGLKGFYGCEGKVVDKMGAIWGKNDP